MSFVDRCACATIQITHYNILHATYLFLIKKYKIHACYQLILDCLFRINRCVIFNGGCIGMNVSENSS